MSEIKFEQLRTSGIDRVVVTDSELNKIMEILHKKGGIGSVAHYIAGMFEEIMVVFLPDNHKAMDNMRMKLHGEKFRKQAVVLKRDNGVGKLVPTTGFWSENKEILEHQIGEYDKTMIEDSVLVLSYLYMMSQVVDETNEITYDDSVTVESYENKVVTMKKVGKRTVRKVKLITRKSLNLNVLQLNKKTYVRIVESWNVRGHWREYKNGNRTWVKGYVKGKGEKTAKEYTI